MISDNGDRNLEPPINLADISMLARAGELSSNYYLTACRIVRDNLYWQRWLSRALLVFAIGQILAGIIFFFAFNWADLPAVAKFSVVQFAIIAAAISWWRVGFDQTLGQAFGAAITILLGVFLAVFGQVYQTGADEYELFLAWAALSLPLALAANSNAHWLVWIVVANIAAVLFLHQSVFTQGLSASSFAVLMMAMNAVILAITEGINKHVRQENWFRYTLFSYLSVIAVISVAVGLFDSSLFSSARVLAVILPMVLAMLIYGWARYHAKELYVVSVGAVSALIMAFLVVLKLCFELFDLNDFAPYLILGLAGPGLAGLAARHLRRMSQILRTGG